MYLALMTFKFILHGHYSGDEVASGAEKAPGKCDKDCAPGSSEKCGGDWTISIYAVNCSGAPVPEPKSPPYLSNPCLNKSSPFPAMPFCNSTLPTADRVADILKRMSVEEKIGCLGTGGGGAVESLGIPNYNWWSEATHVRLVGLRVS